MTSFNAQEQYALQQMFRLNTRTGGEFEELMKLLNGFTDETRTQIITMFLNEQQRRRDTGEVVGDNQFVLLQPPFAPEPRDSESRRPSGQGIHRDLYDHSFVGYQAERGGNYEWQLEDKFF